MYCFVANDCFSLSIDHLNYATGIGIRPRTPVCCIIPVLWRCNFRLHVFCGSAVRIVTLSKTSALYRIRSSMAVSLSTAEDFSPLDSFTSILHKLAMKEFASEILHRHHVIRQQIEALLQLTAELQSLCAVLHKIYDMISRLPVQKGRQHSFQVALWPKFLCILEERVMSMKTIPFLSRVSAETTIECSKRGTA